MKFALKGVTKRDKKNVEYFRLVKCVILLKRTTFQAGMDLDK